MPPSDSGILFDDSLWPLLLIHAPRVVTSRQQEAGLATLATYLRRAERHLSIVDLRQLAEVPLEQRHYQVEWFRQHEVLLRQSLIGMALVIESPVTRLAMSVILHFKPLPSPHHSGPGMEAAASWAAERFQEAGDRLSAARVRQHFRVP
jgi:hypothetical protein